jgi:hypothetical protein
MTNINHMSLHQYFAAHAPEMPETFALNYVAPKPTPPQPPLDWDSPVMNNYRLQVQIYTVGMYAAWANAYADAMVGVYKMKELGDETSQ